MKRHGILLLAAALLSGCTSIFSSSSPPGMAYVGDLAEVRSAREGDTIASAKSQDGTQTYLYIFKGVDSKGGIHVVKMLRSVATEGKRTGLMGWFSNEEPNANEFVFMPEQTLQVSPGVHVVFIRPTPGELQYRIIMTNG